MRTKFILHGMNEDLRLRNTSPAPEEPVGRFSTVDVLE